MGRIHELCSSAIARDDELDTKATLKEGSWNMESCVPSDSELFMVPDGYEDSHSAKIVVDPNDLPFVSAHKKNI